MVKPIIEEEASETLGAPELQLEIGAKQTPTERSIDAQPQQLPIESVKTLQVSYRCALSVN
jgi:hypothetical protein